MVCSVDTDEFWSLTGEYSYSLREGKNIDNSDYLGNTGGEEKVNFELGSSIVDGTYYWCHIISFAEVRTERIKYESSSAKRGAAEYDSSSSLPWILGGVGVLLIGGVVYWFLTKKNVGRKAKKK